MSVEDEYDLGKLCGHIKKHNKMMLRAKYGGCGQSYTCKRMERRGRNILFICPTNRLANANTDHTFCFKQILLDMTMHIIRMLLARVCMSLPF